MLKSPAVRILGYIFFFLFCFIGSLYITFPMNLLKGRIVDEMTRALNSQQKPGPYGKPGRITAEDIQLWRLSGVAFKNLIIYPVTTNPDPPIPYELDVVRVRVQVLPLLLKKAEVFFHVDAYDGSLDGTVVMAGEGFRELKSIVANGDGFAWGKLGVIKEKVKIPSEGTLGLDMNITLGKDPKDHVGTVHVHGEKLAIGPGELTVPAFGTLTLPNVDLGKLDGDIKIQDGKASGPPMTLSGRDIQGQAELPLALKAPMDNSTFTNGVFTFKLADEFLKANPKFQTVVDFAPPLKSARDDEQVFHFRVKGSLKSPDVRPDKGAKIGSSGGK